MTLEEKVYQALSGLGLVDPQIHVDTLKSSIFATIESASFSDISETEQQKLVWEVLRSELSDHEFNAVEFVFTYVPGEYPQQEAG